MVRVATGAVVTNGSHVAPPGLHMGCLVQPLRAPVIRGNPLSREAS